MTTRPLSKLPHGFTLVEVMLSMALVTFLMMVLLAATDAGSRAWRDGQARTDAFQSARTTLELMARELAPAAVDTRTQMVVGSSDVLSALEPNVAPESPVLLWMAPLGEDGTLRAMGYYLYRDPVRHWYRLKRISIAPTLGNGDAAPYFPVISKERGTDGQSRLVSLDAEAARRMAPSPVSATWFTKEWKAADFEEERVVDLATDARPPFVATVADGVVALWVQTYDRQGAPVPWVSKSPVHPRSSLWFNSAAFFQMATAYSTEEDSLTYLAESAQSMRANRVPSAVEITVVTLDSKTLGRVSNLPEQTNVVSAAGVLDVEASREAFFSELGQPPYRIFNARTFSTRTRLINGN